MDFAHEMIEVAKLDPKIDDTCVRSQFVTTKGNFSPPVKYLFPKNQTRHLVNSSNKTLQHMWNVEGHDWCRDNHHHFFSVPFRCAYHGYQLSVGSNVRADTIPDD